MYILARLISDGLDTSIGNILNATEDMDLLAKAIAKKSIILNVDSYDTKNPIKNRICFIGNEFVYNLCILEKEISQKEALEYIEQNNSHVIKYHIICDMTLDFMKFLRTIYDKKSKEYEEEQEIQYALIENRDWFVGGLKSLKCNNPEKYTSELDALIADYEVLREQSNKINNKFDSYVLKNISFSYLKDLYKKFKILKGEN